MTDMTPSVPRNTVANPDSMMARVNTFLDEHVLPYPVKYLTNRITILATLCLLAPLIILANVTVFVLATNSYLNVMSVVVSSTVLLYSTLSEARDRTAAQRREEIAAAHDKMVEARAEADHARLQEIHDHLDDIHKEVMQHISTSLDNIQKLLVERMDQMEAADQEHIASANETINSNLAAHREEFADFKKFIEALRPTTPGETG